MQDKANENDIEAWRRKLIYRSWHRGTKEMDLMLGRFAEAEVKGFGAHELALYEALLTENDPDLYDWLTGKAPPPQACQSVVLSRLLQFYKTGSRG